MAGSFFKHKHAEEEKTRKGTDLPLDPPPDSFIDQFPDNYDTYKIEDIIEDLSAEVTSGVNILTDIFNLLQDEIIEIKSLLTEIHDYYYEKEEEETKNG